MNIYIYIYLQGSFKRSQPRLERSDITECFCCGNNSRPLLMKL